MLLTITRLSESYTVWMLALVILLTGGIAAAQTESGDQLDTGSLLDAVLGVESESAETGPNPDGVAVTPGTPPDLVIGNTLILDAGVTPTDTNATWTSGTPAVASVTSPGLTTTVTGLTVGSSLIEATGNVTAAVSSVTVNVVVATVGVTPATNDIAIGEMVTLTATSDATLDVAFGWISSDITIAVVNPTTGEVTGVKSGTVTITATGSSSGEQGTASVTVSVLGDSSGCFVATAAYGTPLAGEVDALREARDTYLLDNVFGTVFVDTYYRVSPPFAGLVARHETLAGAVRIALWPVVALTGLFLASPAGFTLAASVVFCASALYRSENRKKRLRDC